MLRFTAKSANVGFSQVVQLFAPPTNPATLLSRKFFFYKFGEKIIMGVNNVCINIRV